MLLICTASSGHNLTLARRIAELADELNLPNQVVDLTKTDLPLYTPARDDAGRPPTLASLEDAFSRSSGLLFVAPEYNGSIPPTLTNAIAWLSTQTDDFRSLFTLKPTAIATHSGGGGQKVLVAMRLQLSHLGATVLGRELLTNGKKPLNEASARAVLQQLAALMQV